VVLQILSAANICIKGLILVHAYAQDYTGLLCLRGFICRVVVVRCGWNPYGTASSREAACGCWNSGFTCAALHECVLLAWLDLSCDNGALRVESLWHCVIVAECLRFLEQWVHMRSAT
jgi:hypothetical protein